MFSFEFNKIAGAFLGACVFAMALGILGEGIYTNERPAKAGYELPEPQVEAAAEKPVAAVPLPVLLAKADVSKGQADTKVCQACHNFEKGAGVKVGPPLYGVVDRPKGEVAGFDYSAGLKGKGGNWGFEDLNQFLVNPKGYITGTKMGYAGEADANKRADILAYLRSLSDAPVPLPAAPAAATAEAKPETAGAPAAAATKAEDKASAPSPADPKAAAPAGNMTPGAPSQAAAKALPPAPSPAPATVPPAPAAAPPEPPKSSEPQKSSEPPKASEPQK